MTKTFILSRNFVEFGPFAAREIVDFHSRGIVGDRDYLKPVDSDSWLALPEWIATAPKPAAKARKSATPTAKKPAVMRRQKAA